jgi:hypothetical protein
MIAAQNAVPLDDMAVTSGTTAFFQSIGGLLGAAVFQTVLNNKLAENLAFLSSMGSSSSSSSSSSFDLSSLQPYPDLYARAVAGYANAIDSCFLLVGIPFAVLCFLGCCALEPLPLKDALASGAMMHGEGMPPPPPGAEEAEAAALGAGVSNAAAAGAAVPAATAPGDADCAVSSSSSSDNALGQP